MSCIWFFCLPQGTEISVVLVSWNSSFMYNSKTKQKNKVKTWKMEKPTNKENRNHQHSLPLTSINYDPVDDNDVYDDDDDDNLESWKVFNNFPIFLQYLNKFLLAFCKMPSKKQRKTYFLLIALYFPRISNHFPSFLLLYLMLCYFFYASPCRRKEKHV